MATLFPPPVWHDLVLQNGFTAGHLQICRVGNIVFFRSSSIAVPPSAIGAQIAILPAGFRPNSISQVEMIVNGAVIIVMPDGRILLGEFRGSGTSITSIRINGSYVAEVV